MAKRNSSKSGYGIHNVVKHHITKKDIRLILEKSWKEISSMDVYKLYQRGWKTEEIQKKFGISISSVLNRLRVYE